MTDIRNNQTITIADNPMPRRRKREAGAPKYNTKWSKIFKAVQDTGKRQELVGSDGLWTYGQLQTVTQTAKKWSNRNGFGQIKIQTRSVRIATSGPRHLQYGFRIWATVPAPKAEPEPVESVDVAEPTHVVSPINDDVARLIERIMSL